jgi:demethylmenaquinone methyltransferase/2-methoxy-6-polyprenyl-1,4-benzoquinol methylase
MHDDLQRYCAERANEYDRVYQKPERQGDIARLRETLCGLLKGHRVLEVACGTGYWTEPVGRVAESVLAADINPEVMAIAKQRCRDLPGVRFMAADAYTLAGISGEFTACLAAFWWSHLPKSKIPGFLAVLYSKLPPNALVVFVDNRFVPGSSTPIARTDGEGNRYQVRRLDNGQTYEVLKNFPTENEIREALGDSDSDIRFEALAYYWIVAYRTG